ncbi:MAG: UDP-N-acetylmuramoyl-tripeptide--D-alanyl-D-alanine ligase [Paenibacillaceae bacterium]|nr:UDP-N-acetylmuramoyl-tripeptide--D-alanyl-D-alanine ligase [Paenibacillaceae bacterium]
MRRTDVRTVAFDAGGVWRGAHAPYVHGVAIDSRTVQSGDVFVPLPGVHTDGHAHVEEACDRGAVAVLWSADRPNPPVCAIVVDDPLRALQRWAHAHRVREQYVCVAITGSVGKTSTKQLVHSVLSQTYKTHATDGNQNNEVGLPLTLLRAPEETTHVVTEMGMRGLGQISLLSHIAQPDAAVITCIGEAHIQELGSRARIAEAKAEIVHGLRGVLWCPKEPLLEPWIVQSPHVDVRYIDEEWQIEDVCIDAHQTSFSLQGRTYTIPMLGAHQAHNARYAIAIGRWAGVTEEDIANGLAHTSEIAMRLVPHTTRDGVIVWDDTYNSSPRAVRAALDTLIAASHTGKKYAVLGDMRELGAESVDAHMRIGADARIGLLAGLVTVGEEALAIHDAAKDAHRQTVVRHFAHVADVVHYIKHIVREGDIVLCKGSRSLRMERIVQQLLQ